MAGTRLDIAKQRAEAAQVNYDRLYLATLSNVIADLDALRRHTPSDQMAHFNLARQGLENLATARAGGDVSFLAARPPLALVAGQ